MTCKGWDVKDMVEAHRNFRPVRRISALAPLDELLRELAEYEKSGVPLIIEDWHKHPRWQGELLGIDWLLAHVGDKEIPVRNVHDRKDATMTMSQFVEVSRAQDVHHVPGESERYYWKDGECPSQWKEWLQGALPAPILPGSKDDLLRHLFPSESVETLLCYLGVGDTYTPAHKDLCASSGHNLMLFSENGGTSFWFMTVSADAPNVAEYFQNELGQELDWETHVTTVDEWGHAKFDVYVAEQKVGDLVLVPPRSVHQVVNRGGLAMKMSWSQMSLNNLKTALWSELPVYRRVCRPEQYRIKTVLYRALLHHTDELRSALGNVKGSDANSKASRTGLVDHGSSIDNCDDDETPSLPPPNPKEQLAKRLIQLIRLLMMSCNMNMYRPPSDTLEKNGGDRQVSYNLACDFCGADIFQSFFECQRCRGEDEEKAHIGDGLLICPACYVEGAHALVTTCIPGNVAHLMSYFRTATRRRACGACISTRTPKVGKATSPLQESRLKDSETIRVFEAACALRDMKNNNPAEKMNSTRRCRGSPNHDIPFISGLPCSMCHSTKCYLHLLGSGTHCAEALLASRVSDAFYHRVHRDNTAMSRQRPLALYDVNGADVKDRLVVAARSFPKCKPGHPKLQLGWYDKELEVADTVVDAEMPHPAEPSSQSTIREESPLTPLSSPAKESESPPNFVPKDPKVNVRRAEQSLPDEKDDDSVISIDSDSDDQQNDAVPVTRSSSPVKRKLNRAYVELRSMTTLRRTSSPASVELEPRRKKPRLDRRDGDAEGSTSTRPAGLRASVGAQPPEQRLRQSYSTDLASALTQANGTAPIFTQPILPDRSRTQHQSGVRRIISPDPEGSTPPLGIEPSISLPRLSTGVPVVSKSTVPAQGPQTSMLQVPQRTTRQRYRNSTREHDVSGTVATTPTLEPRAPALPRKRRTGPPGIPRQDFQTYLSRRQSQREATGAGNTAPLQSMDVDEEEKIEVDNTQELRDSHRSKPSSSHSATNQVASPPPTQPEASLSQTSFSSVSSLTVSTQTVGVSPEHTSHPQSSPPVVHPPSGNIPGPSQATPPQPHRTAASSSVLSSTKTGTLLFSDPLRALADSIDSLPDLLRPSVNPELEQAMQHMKDEITGLRAELQAAQSRDAELERRMKNLEDEKTRLQETLRNERLERGHAARNIRELNDRTDRLENKPLPHEDIKAYVRETVSSIMPTLRLQFQELASNAVHDAISSGSINVVQTVALHTAVQPAPHANAPVRQQIDFAKPIPQGPAGYPHPHNRQYGRNGPQRNHGPRPQGEYHEGGRDGRFDRSQYQYGPRYQGPSHHGGHHGGPRDDDRQSHPRPTSPGSHIGSESGRPVNNFNNWSRRQGSSDNDRTRRPDSPRRDRDRSRSPDRRRKDREPTLDYVDSEPTPRLRSAKWGEDPTSSIRQFDDGDDMHAVAGSSTDPELSPIESFRSSEKSPSHSEIQESSFTERDDHAGGEAPKPPTGPKESRQPARSPERGRLHSRTRPIRQ
ncbi:hypothetical protein C8T65DRAFT_786041 [Cerioporus squamosus]|nr:hypothetical protein C8T65DRAFT_786041 [Cerioporus squamosus]